MNATMEAVKFTECFDKWACVGSEIVLKVGKLTVKAEIVHDEFMGPPWEEHDGHGPVSEWTARAKKPGEVVLHEDGGSKRYYDWQEAIKLAKPYGTGTKGQQAERAVKADFDRMQEWCNDGWRWVGVSLSVSKDGVTLAKHAASLYGIESDSNEDEYDYFTEVANELLPEALKAGEAVLEKLCA